MWTSSSPFALHVLATRVAITMQEFRLEQVGDPCQPQKLEVGQPNNYSKKNEVDQFGSLWYSKIDEGVNMTNMTRVRNYMSPK